MRVFLDANVLVSVLNKEYPLFTFSSRILSMTDTQRHQLYTSALALAIAVYFSSKKSGERMAKKKIALLIENMKLTTIDHEVSKKAVMDKRVHDFEDGMQYYSALKASCGIIITEDASDFYFSEIPVVGCEEFILKHL
ncbi:type II toxin-antitoxin system VapC family toxin [Pricia sp.]|uniref:type II toxin-antitoxin system VapC family toxin n=1 Tax=Pricia sp. TaxID=2268138 RepID=UPI003592E912